jgi:leucyl/phenylalanyl-tRNA--protein transferase
MKLHWLSADSPPEFPPTDNALREPDGLIAAGGDLSEARLLAAYRRGIFPWYDARQPILWWTPDPRAVLLPGDFHASRSLLRTIRRRDWRITVNRDFAAVVDRCAEPRPGQGGTWITPEMRDAYVGMHEAGWGHSVEVWLDGLMVGGVYGLAIDRVFFGESMFSAAADASKIALLRLVSLVEADGFGLFDCQVHTGHLQSLGARNLPRADFEQLLSRYCHSLKPHRFDPTSLTGPELIAASGRC